MIIQICVGSACHLKGSEKIVGLFEDALKNMTSKTMLHLPAASAPAGATARA